MARALGKLALYLAIGFLLGLLLRWVGWVVGR